MRGKDREYNVNHGASMTKKFKNSPDFRKGKGIGVDFL